MLVQKAHDAQLTLPRDIQWEAPYVFPSDSFVTFLASSSFFLRGTYGRFGRVGPDGYEETQTPRIGNSITRLRYQGAKPGSTVPPCRFGDSAVKSFTRRRSKGALFSAITKSSSYPKWRHSCGKGSRNGLESPTRGSDISEPPIAGCVDVYSHCWYELQVPPAMQQAQRRFGRCAAAGRSMWSEIPRERLNSQGFCHP